MSPELGEHVEELARELGVIVLPSWAANVECDESPCGASGEIVFEESGIADPIIWVSEEPTTAEAYLVALHELGHHVAASFDAFTNEVLAWTWAEEHSLVPITPHLRNFIDERLETYRGTE